jgi:hypothetical protein
MAHGPCLDSVADEKIEQFVGSHRHGSVQGFGGNWRLGKVTGQDKALRLAFRSQASLNDDLARLSFLPHQAGSTILTQIGRRAFSLLQSSISSAI